MDTARPEGFDWLRGQVDRLMGSSEPWSLVSAEFPAVDRHLGGKLIGHPDLPLKTDCGDLDYRAWSCGTAGRALLLAVAAWLDKTATGPMLRDLFRYGDEQERIAIVRSLCLLPRACEQLPLAREAGRANNLALYAALALDNPFVGHCLPEKDFNQTVLKCLFNRLPISQIAGLERRASPSLSRLCEDYRDERAAAGRSIPADIWLALVPHASARGLALAIDALADPDPIQRRCAAAALRRQPDNASAAAALDLRRQIETEPTVKAVLDLDGPSLN